MSTVLQEAEQLERAANPDHYAAAVWEQAESVARMYLEGERHRQPMTREQKQFIEGIIAADYDGRTVIELLQNGHDAHPPDTSDGRLEFLLDEHRGPHGTLYVANAGNPVSDQDFAGMCRIAMSEKRPDAGIGNKGVGFKSVLQLSDNPEVYSAVAEGADSFSGYRFRFARPEDFDTVAQRICPADSRLGQKLRENVSSLKITLPLEVTPPDVERFAREGYSTVIRLELRSPAALEAARHQLEELASSDVPINLFLPRLASIVIGTRSSNASARYALNYRRKRLPSPTGIDLYQVDLQDSDAYLLLERTVAEGQMLAAIEQARSAGRLNTGWDQWKGDARVSIALPLDRELEKGRTYTFLPMDEAAGAVLPGFVNAPFFARLDRRSLDATSPLNRLLLDAIAALCAEVLVQVQNGVLQLPEHSVIDLLTCDAKQLPALRAALQERGTDLADVRVLPVLGTQPRASLSDCWMWQPKGKTFTPQRVARGGQQGLVDPAIGVARWGRLAQLASSLLLYPRPRPTDVARFAESYATRLAARAAKPRAWSAFLDDLAAEVPNGEALRGRRILLDSDGSLTATNNPGTDSNPGSDSGDGARMTYFVPSTSPGTPPAAVKTRLAFLHPEIAPAGRGRRAPGRGRAWLESQRLVREYRTDAILELVGATMRALAAKNPGNTNDRALRECLQFGYQIWRDARRDISPHAAAAARLLLPTPSGWLPAADTVFGAGWGGSDGDTDKILAQLLERASDVSASLRKLAAATLLEPHDLANVGETVELRHFCEDLGAKHGLVPAHFSRVTFQIAGLAAAHPERLSNFYLPVPPAHQQAWRHTAADWAPAAPAWSTVTYRPDTDVAYLPGQFDWDQLDQRARLDYVSLVLRGLESWPDSDLEFRYVRQGDGTRSVWPTYVSSFLANEAWVPQTTPQDRTAIQFLPVTQAWWLQTEQTPDFLPAQPSALRAFTGPIAGRRLANSGLQYWDIPDTAAARLVTLADVIAEREPRLNASLRHAVRKAYERAWGDLLASDSTLTPHNVLVSADGHYAVVDLDHDPGTVYIGDRFGEAQRQLLSQTSARLVPVRDAALGDRVLDRLRAVGLSTVRGTSQAAVIVTVDGGDAASLPARPLGDWGGQWLELLVAGVIEFRYQGFPPIPDDKVAQARRRVRDATVVTGNRLATVVDGHATSDQAGGSSYLLSTPSDRLAVAADPADRWALLAAAADGLAQLIELTTLSRELKLALLTLEQRCASHDPTDRDLAEVLGVSVDEIEALHASHSSVASSIERLVPVLAMLDPAAAESLVVQSEALPDEATLLQWLAAQLPAAPEPKTLVELAEGEDLLAAARQLNLSLGMANRGLRMLGLAPLHNASGQRQQFDAFLARARAQIQDRIRDRFREAHAQQRPLDDYLRLRELPGLEPDPHWLDEYWDLPEDLLTAHVDAWINGACPPAPTTTQAHTPLPAVDVLRDRGRRTVTETLSRARPLVDAWLHQNTVGTGPRPDDTAAVIAAITAAGQMDFGTLRRRDVLAWLRNHGQWPTDMRLSTELTQLGLDPSDIDEAGRRLQASSDSIRRQATYVTYADKTFGAEPEDLAALADVVRGSISVTMLDTPTDPVLSELPPLPEKTAGGDRSSTWGGAWRGQSPSPGKTKAIGLAGEILAGQWIEHQYGLPPEVTWVSGYRQDVLADGKGNDELGYDFEVVTSAGKILYEVKSTVDDFPQLILGESEVRRASDLAEDEDYRILFITHVLDPARQRLYPLPNPLAAGMRYFNLVDRSFRLQFTLPTEL